MKMEKKEMTRKEIGSRGKKKYTPPRLEVIGEVRETTKGGQHGGTDMNSQSFGGPPSDPNGVPGW